MLYCLLLLTVQSYCICHQLWTYCGLLLLLPTLTMLDILWSHCHPQISSELNSPGVTTLLSCHIQRATLSFTVLARAMALMASQNLSTAWISTSAFLWSMPIAGGTPESGHDCDHDMLYPTRVHYVGPDLHCLPEQLMILRALLGILLLSSARSETEGGASIHQLT